VPLDAFFIAKHELTQAQWRHAASTSPSFYKSASSDPRLDPLHPVESVTWFEVRDLLMRLGLTLPTEAQWEYACRSGTETLWFTGDDVESLQDYANVADATTAKINFFPPNWRHERSLNDPYHVHAPVGSMLANPFGLDSMAGNVAEWCEDQIGSYESTPRKGDGLRDGSGALSRVTRGGSFFGDSLNARAGRRQFSRPSERHAGLGARAARPIQID